MWCRRGTPIRTTWYMRTFHTDNKRVAVIGTGRMGHIRLDGIRQNQHLLLGAIIDPQLTHSQAKIYEARYSAPCFNSIEDPAAINCLNSMDGIWIATPTHTHSKIISRCLKNHSSTLCAIGIEKPVASTLVDLDKAYEECFYHHIHLVCSFQRRFDPHYQQLVHQLPTIGDIQSIHTVFRDHPCPSLEFLKTGGDPFHDLAIHDIDFICTLVGEYPSKVTAFGTSFSTELRQVGVMDKASVWLEFPSTRIIATMDLSRYAPYGYDQRIEVVGTEGMLQVLNPPRTTVLNSLENGVYGDRLISSFPERFFDAYKLELDHFADVLMKRAQPKVHWNAARMATIIAEAARLAAIHKKPVTINYNNSKQDQPRQDPLLHVSYHY